LASVAILAGALSWGKFAMAGCLLANLLLEATHDGSAN
jgi:hypothetical protein